MSWTKEGAARGRAVMSARAERMYQGYASLRPRYTAAQAVRQMRISRPTARKYERRYQAENAS